MDGDLSVDRLLNAYARGIFPWYSEEEPLLWWSPAPRLVLFPEKYHLPRRLARTIRQRKFAISADSAFAEVMALCGDTRRKAGEKTWITQEMQQAYGELFSVGYAHSLECWQEGQLVGGLYGVCLDRLFFGESMFSLARDASKVALAALVAQALRVGIGLIDCQMTTAHLLRFGAEEISRQCFQKYLGLLIDRIQPQHPWRITDMELRDGHLTVRG